MHPLMIAVGGLGVVLILTGLGIGLGRLIDPLTDRLDSSIEWKEYE